MERWQGVYLAVMALGFGVGWFFTPIAAVGFIWTFIVLVELVHYRRKLREIERGSEGS